MCEDGLHGLESESKTKNSHILLTAEQNKSKATAETDLVTAFPGAVHVANVTVHHLPTCFVWLMDSGSILFF